ncbi:MAG TPA: hypothetical protein VMB05_07520 [Solirubrobacteraceae bacterium]|nr:hypothetical protein [Solirubrobacteraceae bacterium]HUB74473.1 hypothetical protein [Solirubrobacteraceae bacterium]
MHSVRKLLGDFRKLWTEPTDDFRGTLNVILIIAAGLATAYIAAHLLSEELRTGGSAFLGAVGSLLVVDQFRARVSVQLKYWILMALVLIVAWLSYPIFDGFHSEFWQSATAGTCGWLVLVVFEFIQRKREEDKSSPETAAASKLNQALISLGCAFIAVGALIAINPL